LAVHHTSIERVSPACPFRPDFGACSFHSLFRCGCLTRRLFPPLTLHVHFSPLLHGRYRFLATWLVRHPAINNIAVLPVSLTLLSPRLPSTTPAMSDWLLPPPSHRYQLHPLHGLATPIRERAEACSLALRPRAVALQGFVMRITPVPHAVRGYLMNGLFQVYAPFSLRGESRLGLAHRSAGETLPAPGVTRDCFTVDSSPIGASQFLCRPD